MAVSEEAAEALEPIGTSPVRVPATEQGAEVHKPMPGRLRVSAAVLLVCSAAAPSVIHAAPSPPCTAMRDPSGDATENPLVGGDLTRLPVSSVPAADAIEILTSHDRAAARLSITMRVTGEPRPDSHSPSGYLYATRFFIGAHELVAMAVTTPDGEQFDVGRLDGTLNPPEQLDGEAVSGAFSLPQRTARVDIPLSVLTQLAGLDGRRATLSGFRAQTYRALGTAATGTTLVLTDDSSGGRSYSVPRAACF